MNKRVLIINPGSSSTKLALYCDGEVEKRADYDHSEEELAPFKHLMDQLPLRQEYLFKTLEQWNIEKGDIAIVIGRGGVLRPLCGGVYEVNDLMLNELHHATYGEHASNLGAPLAFAVAQKYDTVAIVADPVVVDEMSEVAKVSGMPEIQRKSVFHALNQRYVGRLVAKQLGKKYEDARFIVAHLGGGVSIASHMGGKIVDVNNALNGEGPLSPERSGGVPVGDLVDLAYSGKYSHQQLKKMITGEGGILA